MQATYPFLVRDEGTQFSRLIIKRLVYMHDLVHVAYARDFFVIVWNFGTKLF